MWANIAYPDDVDASNRVMFQMVILVNSFVLNHSVVGAIRNLQN